MKLINNVLTIVCLLAAAVAVASGSSIEDRLSQVETQLEGVKRENAFLKTQIGDLNRKIQELESCACGGTTTTETTTWPINTQTEFIDVGIVQGRIAIFKNLGMLVVGWDMNKIYDLRTRKLIRTLDEGLPVVFKQNQLIIAPSYGPISIYNVETGELVNRLVGNYGAYLYSIALNKDQSLMLTGGDDNIVRLWDMVELRQVRTFTGHTGFVSSVVFDEARNQVISGSEDSTIRVWNINDGSLVRIINAHSFGVSKLLLDEETSRLFSASWDTMIKEWDLTSGKELRTFTGHSYGLIDLILSEDGQRLISSSLDGSVIVWDKQSGKLIKGMKHTSGVSSLALNPLNGQLLSTTHNTKLVFWPVKP